MPDVFISYSRRDSEEFVERLTGALTDAGMDVWVDLEDIPAASDWERDLKEGVLGSESLCFVLSPGSVASVHCLNELGEAESRNKRLLPLMHAAIADAEVPPTLRRLNWIPQRGIFEDDFDANVATLVEAIRTDQEALRAHTRWEQRAAEWEQRGRDPSLLARGTEMRQAEDWLAAQTGREPQPTPLQVEYVNASRRGASRRQRIVVGASLAALAISIVLGVVALLQRNEARDQRDLAQSNGLASAADASLDEDPERSLILAATAADLVPTDRTRESLALAITSSQVRSRLESGDGAALEAAVFSGEGDLVATVERDGPVRIWNADSSREVAVIENEGRIVDAAFTPDGSSLLTAGSDGMVREWNTTNGTAGPTFDPPGGALRSMAVSPDGRLLGVAGDDGVATLSALDGGSPQPLRGHSNLVNSIEFSADSSAVITASYDDTARIWDARTGQQREVLRTAADASGLPAISPAEDAEFSPDGEFVASANIDGSSTLWSVAGARPVTTLSQPSRGIVNDVTFNGTEVVLTAGPGRVDAHYVGTGAPLTSYLGHQGPVNGVMVDPTDSNRLLTAGEDGSARIWSFSAQRHRLSANGGAIEQFDFSPDGSQLLSVTGRLELIDLESGRSRMLTPRGPEALSATFDPTGERLAAQVEFRVFIFDAKTGLLRGRSFAPENDQVGELEWSDDGSTILAEGIFEGATLWDADTREQIGAVKQATVAAAISPTGDRVAAYGDTDGVELFDPEGERLIRLGGGSSLANAVDFSGDGERVIAGFDDGVARVWDASDGTQQLTLENGGQPVVDAAFSDDGRFILTNGGETVVIWDAETGIRLLSQRSSDEAAAIAPDGSLFAVTTQAADAGGVFTCDVCVDDQAALLELARSRITREPTPAEVERYGLE